MYITVKEALKLVQSGDKIVTGMAANEAYSFLSEIHTIADKVSDVTIINCLSVAQYEFMKKEYKESFNIDGFFFSGTMRKSYLNGNVAFLPNHLHLAGRKWLFRNTPSIYIGTASLPDENGMISLSTSNVYEMDVLKAAKIKILEVNPNYPNTHGDLRLHQSEVDYLVNVDYDIMLLPDVEISDKDEKIGKFISEFINDGDCLQLGIGSIPNAVANQLVGKKDLGVHTEMFTTGFMNLYRAGAISNTKKNTHKGKMVAAFALGTQELYDFINENPLVEIRNGHYVNDPYVIGLNDNQVSINSTIEIDLTGQCCSESIGTRQFSGTGGQSDTAVGAQRSKNGRSFIALHSTAMVRNSDGIKVEMSKIVPTLKNGAIVSLSRNDVDYVVTEYGVASLRGANVKERAESLIAIAHPKFRDELKMEAIKIGMLEG